MLDAFALALALTVSGGDGPKQADDPSGAANAALWESVIADGTAEELRFKADCVQVVGHVAYCECLAKKLPARTFKEHIERLLARGVPLDRANLKLPLTPEESAGTRLKLSLDARNACLSALK